ncbi:MAG: peptide deformylase [Patescibacteria group bacterium]
MAIRTIITGKDNPVLRARAARVLSFGKDLSKLVRDLHETVEAVKGAGLAAPQINVSSAVTVAKIGGIFTTLVNPEILWRSTEEVLGEEGCLSLPDIWLFVPRAREIVVRFRTERGAEQELELADFDARVVQHEVDHLLGKLIVDYQATSVRTPGQAL